MTVYRPSFRQAAPTDQEELLALVGDYYAYDAIPFDAAAVRPALAQLLNDPSLGHVWFIQIRVETVGYMVLTFGFDFEVGGRVGTVTDLYLKTSYRGRGLGRAALAFVERHAADLGLNVLELQAVRDNAEALAFYTNSGSSGMSALP